LVQHQASLPPYLNAPRRVTESLERLVQLYDAWGKPTPAASGNRNWPRFSKRPKRLRRMERSREPKPLWIAVAKRSGDAALGTREKLSKFSECQSAQKRRRVRLAGALQNLAGFPAAPFTA
jgi:hypothetical protein